MISSLIVIMHSALLDTLMLHSKQAIPPFLYNTFKKKKKTGTLVYQAIISGYKGVDTAALPKYYREDLAGAGVRRALSEGETKYTSRANSRQSTGKTPTKCHMTLLQVYQNKSILPLGRH